MCFRETMTLALLYKDTLFLNSSQQIQLKTSKKYHLQQVKKSIFNIRVYFL